MSDPKPGERFIDTNNGNRVVVYVGENGHNPWWQNADDGRQFHCDWHDYYLWGRFVRTS